MDQLVKTWLASNRPDRSVEKLLARKGFLVSTQWSCSFRDPYRACSYHHHFSTIPRHSCGMLAAEFNSDYLRHDPSIYVTGYNMMAYSQSEFLSGKGVKLLGSIEGLIAVVRDDGVSAKIRIWNPLTEMCRCSKHDNFEFANKAWGFGRRRRRDQPDDFIIVSIESFPDLVDRTVPLAKIYHSSSGEWSKLTTSPEVRIGVEEFAFGGEDFAVGVFSGQSIYWVDHAKDNLIAFSLETEDFSVVRVPGEMTPILNISEANGGLVAICAAKGCGGGWGMYTINVHVSNDGGIEWMSRQIELDVALDLVLGSFGPFVLLRNTAFGFVIIDTRTMRFGPVTSWDDFLRPRNLDGLGEGVTRVTTYTPSLLEVENSRKVILGSDILMD